MAQPISSPPPTPRGRASRERILTAAAELFALHGYAAVTMRDIGAAAALDNSSIYKHFRGKQELASAVVDAASEVLLETVTPLSSAERPRLEQLVAVCVSLSRRLSADPTVARLLLAWLSSAPGTKSGFQVSVRPEDSHRPAWRVVQIGLEWLGRARREGVIRPLDPIEGLVGLLGFLLLRPATEGFLLASQERGRSPEAKRRARARAVEAFVRGTLAPEPAGAARP